LAEGGVFAAADLSSFVAPFGSQLGTIGTDFLSHGTIQFHYEQSQSFITLGREACDHATLQRAGFTAAGLPGYYGADLGHLKRGMMSASRSGPTNEFAGGPMKKKTTKKRMRATRT
jgi:hypothetical protein